MRDLKQEQMSFEEYLKENYEHINEQEAAPADPTVPPAGDAAAPEAAATDAAPVEEPPVEEAPADASQDAPVIGYVMSIIPQDGNPIQAEIYKIGDEMDKVIDGNKKVWKLKVPPTLDSDTNYPGAFIARSDAGIGVIILKNP